MSEHEEVLRRLATHTTGAFGEGFEGPATVGGMVSGLRRVKIKSGPNAGRLMGRFVLEDLEGGLPITLFANQMQQFGHLLEDEAIVLVKGEVRDRGGEFEMTVEEIKPLEKVSGNALAAVELTLREQPKPVLTGIMVKLRDLLREHPGQIPVTLRVQLEGRTVQIAAQEFKVDYGPALHASIEGLLGQGSVKERWAGA